MQLQIFRKIFRRDLEKLKQEISLYKEETKIWVTEKSISNSAGNLCLHLLGNLNTYIGAEIGKSGYTRNRELEFSQKNVPRRELLNNIDRTLETVDRALSNMKEDELEKEYPLLVLAEKTSTGYFLVHLAVHLGYHLGQINYHRRLLDDPSANRMGHL
ncbi:MAG: DUF1572 family protein [Sphingobacteriales bacterium]|nr:DUF1572 family protein [Sphingobacteriales bacterium]